MKAEARGGALLVMDEPLANLVGLVLRHVDIETRTAHDLAETKREVRAWKPAILLADIDRYGEDLSKLIVKGAPLIGLTRKRDTMVKMTAFDRGAYDIIEVPFTPDEIVVRTVAAARRTHGVALTLVPKIMAGALEIDLVNMEVRADGDRLHLSPLEHTLLYLFAGNPGRIMSRTEILDTVWARTTSSRATSSTATCATCG